MLTLEWEWEWEIYDSVLLTRCLNFWILVVVAEVGSRPNHQPMNDNFPKFKVKLGLRLLLCFILNLNRRYGWKKGNI